MKKNVIKIVFVILILVFLVIQIYPVIWLIAAVFVQCRPMQLLYPRTFLLSVFIARQRDMSMERKWNTNGTV